MFICIKHLNYRMVLRICLPMQETQEMQVQSMGQEDSPGGGHVNLLH